jgi:hypothetical protein
MPYPIHHIATPLPKPVIRTWRATSAPVLFSTGLVVGTPEGRQMRYESADGALARGLRQLLDVALAVECGSCDGECSCGQDATTVLDGDAGEVGDRG